MADKCETYRALIEEGAGGGGVGAALGAHLEACAACREFRRGREALVGLLGGLGRVPAPDDFEFRLRARMAARRAPERAPLRLRLAPALTAAAVAACLLVAASVSLRNNPPAAPAIAVRESSPAPTAPSAPVNLGGEERTPVRAVERDAPPQAVARVRVSETPQGRRVVATVEGAGRRNAERPRRAVGVDNFVARGATVIAGHVQNAAVPQSPPRAVPLRTSPETLRVVLRDERGGSYVLPMRSVSFGAQAPVGRGPRPERASYKDKEGVW